MKKQSPPVQPHTCPKCHATLTSDTRRVNGQLVHSMRCVLCGWCDEQSGYYDAKGEWNGR